MSAEEVSLRALVDVMCARADNDNRFQYSYPKTSRFVLLNSSSAAHRILVMCSCDVQYVRRTRKCGENTRTTILLLPVRTKTVEPYLKRFELSEIHSPMPILLSDSHTAHANRTVVSNPSIDLSAVY